MTNGSRGWRGRQGLRIDRWLLAGVLAVGAIQVTFTIAVDPHVRCTLPSDTDAALERAGLAPQERCLSDATAYHLLASELAESSRYLRPFDRVLLDRDRATAEYPPGVPFALSLLDRAGVDSVAGQQAVFGTFTAALTAFASGLLARRLGARGISVLAATMLVGAQPLLLQAHALLMTEGLFAALAVFITLAAMRVVERPAVARAATLGALLGAAALTRGEGLIWTPIAAAAVALAMAPAVARGASRTHSRRAIAAVATLAVAAAVVAPWTIRNQVRLHAFVPVSNNLGTVLDGANCDLTYAGPTIGAWRSTFVPGNTDRDSDCFEGFRIENDDFEESQAADRARREGLHYARGHVGRWPVVTAARVGRSFGLFRPDQQVDLEVFEGRDRSWQWFGTIAWWVTAPLAALGLGFEWRRRGRESLALWIPLVAVVVTTVLTYGNQRFRAGLDAVALVLAVRAVGHLVARRRELTPGGS